MTRKRLRAVMFGPHGSGKRTHTLLLSDFFDVPLISVGRILEEEIEAQSAVGRMIRPYVEQGMLVPDDLINPLVVKRVRRLVTQEKGFILEGYPRNVEQASALEKVCKIPVAIHLKLSDEAAWKRVQGRRECTHCKAVFHLERVPPGELETCLTCGQGLQGRPTDREEAFMSRQAIYHFMTEPLIAFYRKRGVLLSIKADQSVEALQEELQKKLTRLGFAGPFHKKLVE